MNRSELTSIISTTSYETSLLRETVNDLKEQLSNLSKKLGMNMIHTFNTDSLMTPFNIEKGLAGMAAQTPSTAITKKFGF